MLITFDEDIREFTSLYSIFNFIQKEETFCKLCKYSIKFLSHYLLDFNLNDSGLNIKRHVVDKLITARHYKNSRTIRNNYSSKLLIRCVFNRLYSFDQKNFYNDSKSAEISNMKGDVKISEIIFRLKLEPESAFYIPSLQNTINGNRRIDNVIMEFSVHFEYLQLSELQIKHYRFLNYTNLIDNFDTMIYKTNGDQIKKMKSEIREKLYHYQLDIIKGIKHHETFYLGDSTDD